MANERTGWSFERWIPIATFLVSVAAFIFGLGVNWSKVTTVEARQDAAEHAITRAIPETYVRKDVYASDQRRMSESVDRLTSEIAKLSELLDAERVRRSGDRVGRTFDR